MRHYHLFRRAIIAVAVLLVGIAALRMASERADAQTTVNVPTTGVSFPLRAPDGTAAAPSYSFSGATSSGIVNGTGEIQVSISGTVRHRFGASLFSLANDTGRIAFGNFDGDAGIARTAAATLRVSDQNGTAYGTLELNRTVHNGTVFASLGTPANGTVLYCSDCTFANPCAGAGTGAIAKRLAGAWRCD